MSLSYKQAGVDIDAGNALVEEIKPLAKSTDRPGTAGGLGGFGALFDLKAAGYSDPLLVAGTDGVGTKLKVAIDANRHDTVGIDLVAMCVNDLVVQGAEPLFFLDYYATGKLTVGTGRAIVSGIAEGCRQAGCALIGGETAEMPGMYQAGDYDLAGFCVGAVERDAVIDGTGVAEGDVLIGLPSSGPHSNGYSLIRKVVAASGLNYDDEAPFAKGSPLAMPLLAPTAIYVKACLAAIKAGAGGVHALAHITGGGFTENIPRVLPAGLMAEVRAGSWIIPPVFKWLAEVGDIAPAEMMRTFNCGIGMVLAVDPAGLGPVRDVLAAQGHAPVEIGRVARRAEGGPGCAIAGLEDAWRG